MRGLVTNVCARQSVFIEMVAMDWPNQGFVVGTEMLPKHVYQCCCCHCLCIMIILEVPCFSRLLA